MSRVDHAWLRMDSDANLMMIVGVWLLDPHLSRATLAERVRERLLAYPRFRCKAVEDATGGARWVEDAPVELAHHVHAETLQRRAGESAQAALERRVAELAATPLDPHRPLWQFHLIEHYDERGSALVARIHHCIADGIALISVMLSMADGGAPPPAPPEAAHEEGEAHDLLADLLVKPLTDLTVRAIGLVGEGASRGLGALAHPLGPMGASVGASLDGLRIGAQLLQDVSALALMPDDSPTRLKGRATRGKRVAWGEPLPLDDVKAVGRAFGASINDVLLASVAGALGDYLRAQGDDTAGCEMRAMVPVNLRPLEQAHQLGNRFGLAPLLLPVGVQHPVERLLVVRERMGELKKSYQPLLAFAVLAASGLLIKPAQAAVTELFARKASAVMTNVPGPREPIRLCGSTARQVMFWVPQSGDIGLGVSILSYAGGVQFGLIADARMCPEPQAIVARLPPQFEQLLWLALMSPWPVAE